MSVWRDASQSVLAGGNSDGGLQVGTGGRRRLSISWGKANGDHGLGALLLVGNGSKFVYVIFACTRPFCPVYLIVLILGLFIFHISILLQFGLCNIRPVNSAYFYKMLCVAFSSLRAALIFSKVLSL
jgi:hypothetical protein